MIKWNELPVEIQEKMLERQFEQTGKRDASVFVNNMAACTFQNGFYWDETIEGKDFWDDIIFFEKIDVFYEKYPKHNDLGKEIILKDVDTATYIVPTMHLRWYDTGKENHTVELQQLCIVNGESEWRNIEIVKE